MKTPRSPKLRVLILIEIAVLILVFAYGVLQKRSAIEVPVNLAGFEANDALEYIDGSWQVRQEQLNDQGFLVGADATNSNLIYMTSEKMKLPKGDYTLTMQYDNSVTQKVDLLCGKTYKFKLLAGTYHLSKNQPVSIYHFRATEDIPDFRIRVHYNNYGTVNITSMTIVPNANGLKRGLVIVLLLSVLVNYLYLRKEWIRSHRTRLMIMGLVVGVMSAPVFAYGITGAHDLMFHMVRIEGIAEALRAHQFPVRMSPVWLDNYGYPVSVYYGDILLYIPAFLRLCGFSVITSYKFFIVLVNTATMWIAYRCFRGIFRDYKVAVVTAVAYTIAPYRFSCIYQRQALGEYCAMIFFPLIALAMYRIYTTETRSTKRSNVDAILLAGGMLGVILTHTLSAEITVVILVMVALVFAKRTFTWSRLRTILQAAVGTLLAGAFFIVPFVDYYLTVPAQINSDVANGGFALIQWGGAYLTDYFNVFSDPFGWNSEYLYERLALTPGLMLMAGLLFGIGFILKGKASKTTKLYTGFSLLMLWMASNLFPWDFLTLHVWSGVSVIQFPCRFLGPAALFLSLLLGSVLLQMKELPRGKELLDMEPEEQLWSQTQERVENRRNRTAVTWFLVAGALSLMVYLQYYCNYDYVVNYYDTDELDNWAVTSFFLREDTLEQEVTKGLMVNENITSYEKVMDEGLTKQFVVTAGAGGGRVELPIFNYKGWHVRDEQGTEYVLEDGTQDLIAVALPDGFAGTLTATFQSPWYWRVAEVISLLTLLGTVWVVHWKRKYEL